MFYQSNEPGYVGCYLEKWTGTQRVNIASISAGCDNIGANQKFSMSASVKNGQIIGVINGKQVFNVTDSSFTQGTVGVYSHQNEGFADNIVVSLIP